jgi:Family of unknown function (DUF6496)
LSEKVLALGRHTFARLGCLAVFEPFEHSLLDLNNAAFLHARAFNNRTICIHFGFIPDIGICNRMQLIAQKAVVKGHARLIVSWKELEKDVAKKRKRKYSPTAGSDVGSEMRRYKRGTAKSGKRGKGGKVKSRKQAIAIGLSKARKKGKRVPTKKS